MFNQSTFQENGRVLNGGSAVGAEASLQQPVNQVTALKHALVAT